jgi:hypothetical protein
VEQEDMLLILQEKLIAMIVLLDPTPPTKDPLHALNAHPVPTPTRLAPSRVKTVTRVPTNRNPILRNAFQCKKDTTGPVQQPKSNAQRVKQETVVIQLVKNATKEDFKTWQETPHV